MKFRRLLIACLLAIPVLAIPATPATAADASAETVVMTLTFDCWGCGSTTGHAAGTVTGASTSAGANVLAAFSGSFSAFASGGIPGVCTLSASAAGTFSGAVSGNFSLTYVFPGTVVITFSAGARVWVGYMATASINCLGVTSFTFVGGGAGVTI